MSAVESVINKLPADTRKLILEIWSNMPASDRSAFEKLVAAFPTDSNMAKTLVRLAARQYQVISSEKHKVAIVGPTNVGKSTFFNRLIQEKKDQALVSPVPGTTRFNQAADIGLFDLIDTPGADAMGVVGQEEKKRAMAAAAAADFLVIMFDAIQGIKQAELNLFLELTALKKPYIVVLNKIDLVKKESAKAIQSAAQNLGLEPYQILPISALNEKSVAEVIMAIAAAEPGLVTALGRALPEYRWKLAWKTIVGSASLAAAIALTPLPILDFGPLVVTQAVMVLSLAKIYDYKLNLARARELVLSFGLGLLGRTLFMEISKVAGVPGWILSSAIATSITVVIGYATVLLFDKGTKLTKVELNKLTRTLTAYLADQLKHFGKKRPDKKTLQETLRQTLEESGFAEQAGTQHAPEGDAINK